MGEGLPVFIGGVIPRVFHSLHRDVRDVIAVVVPRDGVGDLFAADPGIDAVVVECDVATRVPRGE